jgi:cell division protein FtsL
MYAQKKSIENVHIVRERDRRRSRELLAVFVVGIPIALFLLLFTWQNLEVIRLGHQATALQKQRKQLETQNQSLQFEFDRLTSLQSVEQKAAALGFERTDPRVVVLVNRSPVAGRRSPENAPMDPATGDRRPATVGAKQ